MDPSRLEAAKFWCLALSWALSLTLHLQGAGSVERKVGIQLVSYSNTNGTLLNGSCCDDQPWTSGSCPPDRCDSAFVFCIRHFSNHSSCDYRYETTSIKNNNSVLQFGDYIDESDKLTSTRSFIALPVTTMEALTIEVDVVEVDPPDSAGNGSAMAYFSLNVTDTHPFTNHPIWDNHVLSNGIVTLSLNVTSYCSNHYYGPTCELLCRDTDDSSGHYSCGTNGTKQCISGYTDQGADCREIIDLCQPDSCFNGGTCRKAVNDFICDCTPGYTGKRCDSIITTTTALTSPSVGSSLITILTTATPTPTTAAATTTTTTTTQKTSPLSVPNASRQKSQKPADDSGPGAGVIAGPVVGVLVLAAASAAVGFYLYRKRKRQVAPIEEPADEESGQAEEKETQDQASVPQDEESQAAPHIESQDPAAE